MEIALDLSEDVQPRAARHQLAYRLDKKKNPHVLHFLNAHYGFEWESDVSVEGCC